MMPKSQPSSFIISDPLCSSAESSILRVQLFDRSAICVSFNPRVRRCSCVCGSLRLVLDLVLVLVLGRILEPNLALVSILQLPNFAIIRSLLAVYLLRS